MTTRSGFIGLAGRPNVGKSTLVNALVGRHVAIVSVRPQTTRRAIRGVATDLEAERQLVLVDLPGVQRPRDALTKRMQARVERELAESDVALLVINGEEGVGPGDRFIAGLLKAARVEIPVICAVNKCDKIARARHHRRAHRGRRRCPASTRSSRSAPARARASTSSSTGSAS